MPPFSHVTEIPKAVAGQARRRRARERQERLLRQETRQCGIEIQAIDRQRSLHPEPAIAETLALVAVQHLPATGSLLAEGAGPGSLHLRDALAGIAADSPANLLDRAEVGFAQRRG